MFLFIKTIIISLLLLTASAGNNYHTILKKYSAHQLNKSVMRAGAPIKKTLVIYKDNNTRTIEKLVIPWLIYYTNTYRKEHGVDTLKYDPCLAKAAGYQTDYLFNESKKNQEYKLVHMQDHNSPWFTGESPSDRALTAGCKKYCGENALYTTIESVAAKDFKNRQLLNVAAKKIARDMVYTLWNNSKGHRENMLTKDYTCLGVSVAIGK